MEKLTKEDYKMIVSYISGLRFAVLNQPFPRDLDGNLRKQVQDAIVEHADEMQAMIDRVCRIHLD